MFVGDDRSASDLLSRAMVRARAIGAVTRLPHTLANLAQLEAWTGDFARARSLATEGVTLARDSGQDGFAAQCLALLAWIAAAHGRTVDVDAYAGEALDVASERGARPPVALASWAIAFQAVGEGRWADAMARLEAIADPRSAVHHPIAAVLSTGDLVECGCRVEQLAPAHDAVARLAEFARSSWTRALLARSQALLADGDAAVAFFESALVHYAESERRFDEARTHLLFGELLRRERRRTDARVQLRAALDTFERLGADPWAERARGELRATGETARKREVGALTELTPQQHQIVGLVAEGATNKEVAAQLFLSPRTVDYHLRNVFVKLGITSRAELIRLAQ
jgi:DNA-binding CsgD family transcriptional regulator